MKKNILAIFVGISFLFACNNRNSNNMLENNNRHGVIKTLKKIVPAILFFSSANVGSSQSNDSSSNLSNDTYCNNLWAPTYTMSLGVDLTNFDLYGEKPEWSIPPLVKYTCNEQKTWINDVNQIQYNLPDQLEGQPVAIPSSVITYTSSQTLTTHLLKEAMSASLSESYVFGLFSKSKTVSEAFQGMSIDDSFWVRMNSSVSSYRVSLIPYSINPNGLQLSNDAISYIQNIILPFGAKFNNCTATSFYDFFKNFGTHYFQTSYTGGSFYLRCQSNKLLLEEMAQDNINAQGQINFMNFLKKSGAVSGSIEQLNALYESLTLTMAECKGGTFCPTNSNDYDKWQKSVASTPWILSATFEPVYKLINFNKTLQNSFEIAIQNYQQFAYLNEIENNIDEASQTIKNNSYTCVCDGRSCKTLPAPNVVTSCDPCGGYLGTRQDYYHSYVTPNTLEEFHLNLVKLQQIFGGYINKIRNNLKLLLNNNVIQNEILYNQTTNLWIIIVNATQSGFTSDYTIYKESGSMCVDWYGCCFTCVCGNVYPHAPCGVENFHCGKKGVTCTNTYICKNTTYHASWPYMFYLINSSII